MDDAGAVILGVSPDSVDVLSNWRAEENLQYNLLSDPDHEVADRYGVWGEKKMYGKAYEGIIRSHFVIDEHGRLEDVQYKVSPEKSVEEALRQITS
jgi:thioredoxin-dependent peroxiredoxin